jgi:hypothetical protein
MKRQDVPVEQNTLDDPQWYRDLDINTVAADSHDMSDSHPAIRTLGGALDFLHGLEHDLTKWWQHEVEEGRTPPDQLPDWIRRNLPFQPTKITVSAIPEASEDVDFSTFTLGAVANQAFQMVVRPRQDRIRAVITNWGPGVIYVSHLTVPPSSVTAGDSNMAQIAVGSSREIRSRGTVYAYPTPGSAPVIDVQDEFGYRNA